MNTKKLKIESYKMPTLVPDGPAHMGATLVPSEPPLCGVQPIPVARPTTFRPARNVNSGRYFGQRGSLQIARSHDS
jgi:hypothetical protein